MNRFEKYFNTDMSEFQITKVYFTMIDGLSDEERKELYDAAWPIWSAVIKKELKYAREHEMMMGY